MPRQPPAPLPPRSITRRVVRGGPGDAAAVCHRKRSVSWRKTGGTPGVLPRALSTSCGVPAGSCLQPLIAQDFLSLFQCLIAGFLHASSTCIALQRSS